VVLAQQQQEAVQHHEQEAAIATSPMKPPQKYCTVVENGKVVVHSIETPQA
jgi:hypothetical protein